MPTPAISPGHWTVTKVGQPHCRNRSPRFQGQGSRAPESFPGSSLQSHMGKVRTVGRRLSQFWPQRHLTPGPWKCCAPGDGPPPQGRAPHAFCPVRSGAPEASAPTTPSCCPAASQTPGQVGSGAGDSQRLEEGDERAPLPGMEGDSGEAQNLLTVQPPWFQSEKREEAGACALSP